MRSRNPIPAILLTAVMVTSLAFAQESTTQPRPGGGGSGAGLPIAAGMIERVRTALGELQLSSEQKTQMDALLKKAQDDLAAMKGDLESMDFRERAAEVRQFLESVRGDVAQVLTPEQRAQMEGKIDEARQRFRGRGGRPGAPPSPPAAAPRPAGGKPEGEVLIDRLRDSLAKLELSDEQKASLKSVFDDLKEKGDALRAETANNGPDVREKLRAAMNDVRAKVKEILTPEQQASLREMMGPPPDEMRGEPGPERRSGRPQDRPQGGGKERGKTAAADTMMMDDGMAAGAAGGKNPAVATGGEKSLPAGPAIGDAAPDLSLQKLDGSKFTLSAMKGRVVVIVFGSYSSPSFRNRAAALEKLKTDFGTRAQFVIVYSREAHPAGEWDVSRNKEEGISVEQPRSADARKAAAQTAREKLNLATPIALDSVGNDAAIAYGAGANSAYVIDRDGKILARQRWFEPLALKRALDAATKSAATKSAAAGNAAPANTAATQ